MAGNYEEYTTRIFLNDSQAQDKINKLRENIKQYRKDKEAALSVGGKEGDKAWRTADKNIRSAEAELKKLSTTAQSVNRVLGNLDTSSVKDIRQTIKAINKELSSGRVTRNSAEWKALTAQLKRAKTELAGIEAESRIIEKKGLFARMTDSLNKNWGAITQFVGGITMLSMTIRQTTNSYAQMEEEMANVRKYTGQTAEEVKAMNEEFKAIDTRTSREELNQLAGAAGRLGITSHDEIMEFVDAADKINVALGEDLGDDAVATIGKLAMAFGEDETMGLRGAMLASGSAINEMAQNSSASASYLVDFAARLSGIGQQAGMTQAELIGLGSVMDENMQRDEMASTALSNLITKLATDSSKFAKIAGIDVKEFADLVQNDMNGALLKLAKTLQGKGGLMKLAPLFNEMGLDGSRAVGVLTVLANKVDDVQKNQKLATKAYKEGISVLNEFNVQNNTVQAGIDKNVKKFKDLSIELGEKLLPVVKYTISGGALLVKSLSAIIDFLTKYKTTVIAVTASLVILNAKKLYNIALTKLEVLWTNNLKKAMMAAWAVMKKNPYAAIAAGVVAIGAAIYDLMTAESEHVKAIKKEQEEAKEFQRGISESAAATQAQYKKLQQEYKNCKNTHEKREWIRKSQQSFSELGISVGDVNTAEKVFVKNTKFMMEAFKKRAEAAAWQTKLEELYSKRLTIAAEAEKEKQKYYVGAKIYGVGSYEEGEVTQNPTTGEVFWNAKGVARKHAEIDAATGLAAIDKQIEDVAQHAADASKGVEELLASAGVDSFNSSGGGGGNGNSGSTDDKESKERIKRMREAEKHEKAELNKHLTNLALEYAHGTISYSEFLKRKEKMQLDSLNRRKAIWGEESDEAKNMSKEELKIREDRARHMTQQTDMQIQQERAKIEAFLQTMFYDKKSGLYMNEDALNEALFQNEIDAIDKMMSIRNEGSEEWLRLKFEKEQMENEHSLGQQISYQERLSQLRKQYGEKSAEEERQIAINGLDKIHEEGLISEEEYQKMLLQIKGYYAEGGPGHNTKVFNDKSNSLLSIAKEKAGDASDPEKDNTMDALFGNDFKNWKAVNDQISELERQYAAERVDVHKEANAAKAQNDAEYFETLLSKTQMVYGMINNVVNAAAEYSKACSDLEVAKIEKNYDKQIKAAGNNSKKKERLEKKRDEEIRKAKTKANRKAMKIQIAQAIATSAMSALEAYASVIKALPYPANMVMAPIAAGMALAAGALQIATIKKQNAAQEAGYYEGGFTGGRNYRKRAGVVHEGEFVANHQTVANPNILPALELIDAAQRNNTVATLTSADITRAMGGSQTVTPVINVTADNSELSSAMEEMSVTVNELKKLLESGDIKTYVMMEGDLGIYKQTKRYERLLKNK